MFDAGTLEESIICMKCMENDKIYYGTIREIGTWKQGKEVRHNKTMTVPIDPENIL